MKIVIEHGETKREIEGPFNLCGSSEDLRSLANQILQQARDNHTYGWIQIVERVQPSIVDTPCKGWDAD